MPAFYHYLFAFALIARASDLLTTWLVTPTLKLEANPIVRKFRWPYAFLTLFTAFFAYWWPEVSVALTTGSFLVAGSNAMKIPLARSLGEEAYFQMAIESAAKGSFWPGLAARLAPCPFYALLACFIFFFFRTPDTWAFWIAFGVVMYCVALVVFYSRSYVRFRKLGKKFIDSAAS
jgi:hypothetical protein